MAELFEADHGFLAGLFACVGEDFEGSRGVTNPVVGREQGRGEAETAEEERAAHATFIMARIAVVGRRLVLLE
jgi:hypothetical protein